jgi:hypothetical protein
MAAMRRFFFTDGPDQLTIHLKSGQRGSARWGQPDDGNAFPPEVRCPLLTARMKQGDYSARLGILRRATRLLAK